MDQTADETDATAGVADDAPADVAAAVLRTHIAGLRHATMTAELALRDLAGGTRDDVDPVVRLLAGNPGVARDIRDRVLGPVLTMGDSIHRDVLMRSLAAWVDAGYDTVAAAEAIFCDRNTIYNRLRRVERLTGFDWHRDFVMITLAVEAWRLLDGKDHARTAGP